MKNIQLVIFILLLPFTIIAEKQAFMVYGQDFMISIPLPEDWQVDMDFAHQNGINAFFYINELGIKDSPVGIIMTLASRPNEKTKLSEYVTHDNKMLSGYYPEMVINQIEDTLPQENNYEYQLFKFIDKPDGRIQYIAYIDSYQKYFTKLYIDCKEKVEVDKYINDFIESVSEMHYMNITLEVE